MISYAHVITFSIVTYFSSDALVNCYTGHKDSVSSLAFSMDGQLLASGGLDGLVQIWDPSSGNLKCTLEGPGGGVEVRSLKFSEKLFLPHYFENEVLNISYDFSVGQLASKRTYSVGWF